MLVSARTYARCCDSANAISELGEYPDPKQELINVVKVWQVVSLHTIYTTNCTLVKIIQPSRPSVTSRKG